MDLVLINTEVSFLGSDIPPNTANYIKAIDTTFNSLRNSYGIVSATSCVGNST